MTDRLTRFIALLLFAGIGFAGCGASDEPNVLHWGVRGGVPGHFSGPRAIEARNGLVYVVDRLGRVQKFDAQGKYLLEWRIVPNDNGTPTSISIDEKGDVWIPDTHNARVLHYSPDGQLIASFGEYGPEEGKFTYLTGVCFGKTGDLFIAEYGVHDRVQMFSREGKYLGRVWGDHGEFEDQFNRPMAIERGPDGLLYITDGANHRLKVYTEEGKLVRIIGKQGEKLGEFDFPYGLDIDAQGNLFVAEFANHRIQKLSPMGEPLGYWGSLGSAVGQLYEPWGVSVCGDQFFICDTKNNRIQAPLLSMLHPPK